MKQFYEAGQEHNRHQKKETAKTPYVNERFPNCSMVSESLYLQNQHIATYYLNYVILPPLSTVYLLNAKTFLDTHNSH